MHPLIRKKARVFTLLSLVLLSQCCCCILPVGWQVRQEAPAVRAVLENVGNFFEDWTAAGGNGFVRFR